MIFKLSSYLVTSITDPTYQHIRFHFSLLQNTGILFKNGADITWQTIKDNNRNSNHMTEEQKHHITSLKKKNLSFTRKKINNNQKKNKKKQINSKGRGGVCVVSPGRFRGHHIYCETLFISFFFFNQPTNQEQGN